MHERARALPQVQVELSQRARHRITITMLMGLGFFSPSHIFVLLQDDDEVTVPLLSAPSLA